MHEREFPMGTVLPSDAKLLFMHTLAFDGRSGASGDMLLGALLAIGADRGALDPIEAALDVEFRADSTVKNGIDSTAVSVVLAADRDSPHVDNHDSPHVDDRDSPHVDDRDAHTAEGHGPHRHYEEVIEIVESIDLPAAVIDSAIGAFRRLGEAEATIHGESLSAIHFHEVGADDAIADVTGVMALLADLDPDRVLTTPIAVGGGTVEMSHGIYPIPAPAVVEIAADAEWSIVGGSVEAELLTPTGAAILAEIADGVDTLPSIDVKASGYGAGTRTFDRHPNVLRVISGHAGGGLSTESITVLETNLDDATPETLGSLQETLEAAGARDVSIVPTTMKKSRPGHLVKVIVHPADAERVAHRLAVETGTLGVREHGAGHRWTADRAFETARIETDGERFDVSVKVASTTDGAVYDVSAEYDDVAAVAAEAGLAVREVARRAEAIVHRRLDDPIGN